MQQPGPFQYGAPQTACAQGLQQQQQQQTLLGTHAVTQMPAQVSTAGHWQPAHQGLSLPTNVPGSVGRGQQWEMQLQRQILLEQQQQQLAQQQQRHQQQLFQQRQQQLAQQQLAQQQLLAPQQQQQQQQQLALEQLVLQRRQMQQQQSQPQTSGWPPAYLQQSPRAQTPSVPPAAQQAMHSCQAFSMPPSASVAGHSQQVSAQQQPSPYLGAASTLAASQSQYVPLEVQRHQLMLQQQLAMRRRQEAAGLPSMMPHSTAVLPGTPSGRSQPAAAPYQVAVSSYAAQQQQQLQRQWQQQTQQAPLQAGQSAERLPEPQQPGKVQLPLPLLTPCLVFPSDFEKTEGKRLRLALQSGVASELAWALNVLALSSSAAASPLVLRHHPDLLPLVLQVMEDSLGGSSLGYVKVDSDSAAEEQPFVGPPCKRPRRAVDAPQGEAWERHAAVAAPLHVSDQQQAVSPDDASQAVCVSNILRNWALLPGSEQLLADAACVNALARALAAAAADGSEAAAAELAGNLLDVLQQVCGRVQLEGGCDADALLSALSVCLAPGQPLPHRTAAATALAALVAPREQAACIERWLTGDSHSADHAAGGTAHSIGGTVQLNGGGDEPAAPAGEQGAGGNACTSTYDCSDVVAAQRAPSLLGRMAALINCTAPDVRAAAAAGLPKDMAANAAVVDGLGQALQAAAMHAGVEALCRLLAAAAAAAMAGRPAGRDEAAGRALSALLGTCPAAARALVNVAMGAVTPAAAFQLAPPLRAHVVRLTHEARIEAAGALRLLAPVTSLLRPHAGALAAAALQASPVAGDLAHVVAVMGQPTDKPQLV